MDDYNISYSGDYYLDYFSDINWSEPGIIQHVGLVEEPSVYNEQETNFTVSSIHYELIGFQAFCRGNGSECANLTFAECGSCSVGQASAFAAVILLLGLAKLVGNLLVVWSIQKKNSKNKFDVLKTSLAFADFLSVLLIFSVTIPNLIWSMNASSVDMLNAVTSSFNTSVSYFASIFFVFGFTASLFHLALMSIQRFYAVRFPIRYKMQGNRPVALSLVLVWILAVTSATIPAWMPNTFEFAYNHVLYLYYPTFALATSNISYAPTIVLTLLFLVLPYLIMIVLVFITAWYIKTIVGRDAAKCTDDHHSGSRHAEKREVAVLVTVAMMIAGFTATLVPTVIVVSLYYIGVLTRDTYAQPYLVTFYLSMASSLVNIVVYSFRDNDFQKTARSLLFCSTKEDQRPKTSKTLRSLRSSSDFGRSTTIMSIDENDS